MRSQAPKLRRIRLAKALEFLGTGRGSVQKLLALSFGFLSLDIERFNVYRGYVVSIAVSWCLVICYMAAPAVPQACWAALCVASGHIPRGELAAPSDALTLDKVIKRAHAVAEALQIVSV